MGGQAFTHPGPNGEPALDTPRMSAAVYSSMRTYYATILQGFYENVATPAEGVGKTDFGDVDFTVSSPIAQPDPDHSTTNGTGREFSDLISAAFNARRSIHESPTTSSFAVPVVTVTATNNDKVRSIVYAQIDVHVCQPHLFTWTVFHESYGDLWQILGLMLRPHGLTPTHNGLFARIPEIEVTSPKASFVFLTRDPATTMSFLGLDAAVYAAGFQAEEHVFAWIAGCRLFSRAAFESHAMKASDRTRARKRAMYRRFWAKWLPTPSAERLLHDPIDRAVVFEETVAYFGLVEECRRMGDAFTAEQGEKELWRAVAEVVPLEGHKLNLTVRGLKRWVKFKHSPYVERWVVPFIADAPELDCEKQPFWTANGRPDTPDLLAWVQENWVEVKDKERAREKADAEIRKREREAAKEIPSVAEI